MPFPKPSDLSTIPERSEHDTEASNNNNNNNLVRNRSDPESYPSTISQVTEASEGYDIPVSDQFLGSALGGLPSYLEADEEEAYFEETSLTPPPHPPRLSPHTSAASGGGSATQMNVVEAESFSRNVGSMASTPSGSLFMEEDPKYTSRSPDAPYKRKWLRRGLAGAFLVVVTIVAIATGVAVGSAVSSSSSSYSASESPDSTNTTDKNDVMHQPILPSNDLPVNNNNTQGNITKPTLIPPFSMIEQKPPTETEDGENVDNDSQNPEVMDDERPSQNPDDCPQLPEQLPQQQPPSPYDGSRIARYRVIWREFSSPETGSCQAQNALAATAECLNGGTAVVFSGRDVCTAEESQISCSDTTNNWLEFGCVGSSDNELRMRLKVEDGLAKCSAPGNEHVVAVSADCESSETYSFSCPGLYNLNLRLEGDVPRCATGFRVGNFCSSDSCSFRFQGAVLVTSNVASCAQDFSRSREPGERCDVDIECTSNVCVSGTCREDRGC